MRLAILVWSSLFLTLLVSANSHAFGVVNFIGQGAEHEKVTRLALKDEGFDRQTLDELAGKNSKFGAVGAPDRPANGMLGASDIHCDDADFLNIPNYPQGEGEARRKLVACRNAVFKSLNRAVRLSGQLVSRDALLVDGQYPTKSPCVFLGVSGRAKCDVLQAMGAAFHTVQDFYAHTNWTDIPADGPLDPMNPPGLGQEGPIPFLDPAKNGPLPVGLMSGCYEWISKGKRCIDKGENSRVQHSQLNKDVGYINVRSGRIGKGNSSRGKINGNFERAVKAAILDTRSKWRFFEDAVIASYGAKRGGVILCALKRDDEESCN